MKKPFLHALAAALYIAMIISVIFSTSSLVEKHEDNILMPMTMLALFVLSAAVMGYLFLSEPLYLLLEKRKQEAAAFFTKVVGFFACFVVLFAILILLI